MKRMFAAAAALVVAFGAWALPSVEQVQAAVRQGHYAQAETMMQEVVQAKPGSARAHYILAEVLAHNGRFDDAAREAARARELDPSLGFTQPDKFEAFERLLAKARASSSAAVVNAAPPNRAGAAGSSLPAAIPAPAPSAQGGVPAWIWGVGGLAVALLLWRVVATRQRRASQGMAYTGAASGSWPGAYQPPYPPGSMVGPSYAQPGMGRGMLGTGLAAAGGFAAGMLAEKMMDGGHAAPHATPPSDHAPGGLVPGMFDDAAAERLQASDALEQQSIDFGSGADWGGDVGAGSDGGGDW